MYVIGEDGVISDGGNGILFPCDSNFRPSAFLSGFDTDGNITLGKFTPEGKLQVDASITIGDVTIGDVGLLLQVGLLKQLQGGVLNPDATTYAAYVQDQRLTFLGSDLSTHFTNTTIAVTQSGAFTAGRTWTLNSGTDSVSSVQSGLWTVQQGGAPWSQNITQVGGSALTLGSNTSAGSIPVVIASDQAAFPVTVTGEGLATEATLATRLADATFIGRINTFGQKTMATSTPVVLSSDQSSIPVSQSGTWNVTNITGTISLPTGASTEATLASIKTQTDKLNFTATRLLVDGSGVTQPVSGPLTDAQLRASAVPISVASLPLPSGASTSANQVTELASLASIDSKFNSLGQKTMAGSVPVVLSSDQSSIPVVATQSGVWNITNVSGTVSLPTGASTAANQTTANASLSSIDSKTPALGQALAAASVPVVLTAAQIATLTPLSTITANQGGAPWSQNITQIGGGALALGQTTMASSVPVVFASNQTALTVAQATAANLNATVVQATGTNLHAVIDSGSISATQSGAWTTGRTWTLSSGTDSVAAVQSGVWNITNISGTVSLPTGASTAAKQPALGTAGTASSDVITIQGIAGMTAVKVDGSGVTQPISAVALPLPAGASTSANQTTANTSLSSIVTELTHGQATMANSVPMVIASDQGPLTSGTATITTVAGNAASVTILASNSSRKMATVFNDSTHAAAVLYLAFGATASTIVYTVQVPAGSLYEFPTPIYTGAINGIWSTNTTANARITEFT